MRAHGFWIGIIVVLLLVVLVTMSYTVNGVHGLRLALEHSQEISVMTSNFTSTWTSGGITVTVTTTREDPTWTNAEWAAEHRARVDAMLVEFPKDS